ncbi:DUF3825 domain-containing protein [Streptomyces sp. NPDC006510]|uniref:DUF3825 domain-containing protein n=1 Tax=Streptomyces sp. NPDC006510 TaxID=3155600 RepID=UPI00339DBD00
MARPCPSRRASGGHRIRVPLYLADPATPDAVLVISRGDMSYRSTAIVSLADAYKASRLITPPPPFHTAHQAPDAEDSPC